MVAKLIERGLQGQGSDIVIKGDEFLLGRGSDCDLCLHDVNVSRHHCLIRIRGSEITLADLGSSNGTYVNGSRVISQVALRSGDEIRLGDLRFILDLGEARPDQKLQDAMNTTVKLAVDTLKTQQGT